MKLVVSLLILSIGLTSCTQFQAGHGFNRSDGYRGGSNSFRSQGKFKGMGELNAPYGKDQWPGGEKDYSNLRSQDFRLTWPVSKVKISQVYRPRKNPSHEGVDFVQGYRAPILAAHQGTVIYTGSQYRGYGRMIIIEYNGEWATLYGHLEDIRVEEGDWVYAGERIGSMGNTGRSSGVHLHFELLRNKQPVNPLNYLKRKQQIADH